MLAALDPARPRISVDRTASHLWYTLCVVPQSQKWVCERAKELEIETYAPMKREPPAPNPRFPNRSREPVESPLMSGYVFVSLATIKPRFDLFQPFDRESDRPEPLPPDVRAGYVANYAQPAVEPIWGCRGFLSGPDGPMAVSEAVVADMRHREAIGEFDLTGLSEDGRHFVPKWVRVRAWVQLVAGPFDCHHGNIVEVLSSTLIIVEISIFGRRTPITVPLDWVRLARNADDALLISKKNRSKRRSPETA